LIVEVHPQEVADAAMLRLIETLATFEAAIAAGATPHEPSMIEIARVFARIKKMQAAA
jgi:hypothetical protein